MAETANRNRRHILACLTIDDPFLRPVYGRLGSEARDNHLETGSLPSRAYRG